MTFQPLLFCDRLLNFIFLLHYSACQKRQNQYSIKMPKDYFNWDDQRRASITNEEKEQENIEKALEFIDQILR